MITEESLHEKYVKMSTDDLLEIVSRKDDYTELAIAVALKELKSRKVPDEEIKEHKPVILEVESNWIENALFDLTLSQKLFFFCSWFVRVVVKKFHLKWRYNFKADGYLLKSNQSNYYTITGGIVFFVSVIVAAGSFSSFLFFWLCGFGVSYLFDILYNKDRQVRKLEEIIKTGKLPYGYFDI